MLTRLTPWLAKRKLAKTPFYLRTTYEFDGATLHASDPLGPDQSILVAKISKVAIETNCLGPVAEDVFWRIESDSQVILVPQRSPVFAELMKHFESFERFDWEAFHRAMSCTDDALFPCWAREAPHEQQH